MTLPTLFERISNDPTIDSWGALAQELAPKQCELDSMHDHVVELMEIQAHIQETLDVYLERADVAINNGQQVKGYKQSKGRTSRKVIDATRAAIALHSHGIDPDAIYEEKLVGVPQMEKLLKAVGKSQGEIKAILEEFVESSMTAPKTSLA